MTETTLEALIEEQRYRIPYLCSYEICGDWEYEYPDTQAKAYYCWLAKAKRFVILNYPNDKDTTVFEKLSEEELTPEQQNKLLGILEAFAMFPTIIPERQIQQTPQKKSPENPAFNININNTNTQSQSQEQSLAVEIFIEAIKDDLTGKQIKELKVVVAEVDNDLEKARPSIIEKLKSFGSDVASNIVANILTNPAIWGGL